MRDERKLEKPLYRSFDRSKSEDKKRDFVEEYARSTRSTFREHSLSPVRPASNIPLISLSPDLPRSRGAENLQNKHANPSSSNIQYDPRQIDLTDDLPKEIATRSYSHQSTVNNQDIPYPSRLYECKGKLILILDTMNCGILNLEGADQRTAFCLFFIKDLFLREDSMSGRRQLPLGRTLNVNARLMSANDKIPYMASTVWDSGLDIPQTQMIKMFQEPDAKDRADYYALAKDLTWKLPSSSSIELMSEGTKPRLQTKIQTVVLSDDEEEDQYQCGGSGRSSSIECLYVEDDHDKSKKSKKRKKSPVKHKKKKKRKITDHEDEKIYKATIKSFINDEFGVLEFEIDDTSEKAYFNFNQVWFLHNTTKFRLLRELHPTKSLRYLYQPGDFVNCKLRKIYQKDVHYQALAVWTQDGEPHFEVNANLEKDLQYQLSVLKYFKKKKKKYLNIDPLPSKYKVIEGVVTDYFSYEVGFIKLKHESSVVLFHLDQVWIQCKGWTFMKNDKSHMLQSVFPVGEKVNLLVRPIPCWSYSHLTHQALAVWKSSKDDGPLPDFYDKYDQTDRKILLANKLEKQYNIFKSLASLDKDPCKSKFPLVPAVLNGLPKDWTAKISEQLSSTCAIISIKIPSESSINSYLHVLCHLNDIYDSNGKKIQDQYKSLDSVLDSSVDLTARSICDRLVPSTLLTLNEDLKSSGLWNKQPLLQAISVWILEKDKQGPQNIPKPTLLGLSPGNFRSPIKSYYYFNFMLKAQLDKKLNYYLNLAKSKDQYLGTLNPFWTPVDTAAEQEILDCLSSIDTNSSNKIVYGSIDTKSLWRGDESLDLQPLLGSLYCKPILLHRDGFTSRSGIVQFDLPNSNTKCFAYFDAACIVTFDGTLLHEKDLVEFIPVNTTDLFRAQFILWNPTHEVPYMTASLWNELSRNKEKKSIPPPKVVSIEPGRIAKLQKIIKLHSSEIEVLEEISTSKRKIESLEDFDKSGEVTSSPALSSEGGKDSSITPDQTQAPNLIPVPPGISTCSNVGFVDLNTMMTVKEEIVISLINCSGYVEQILGSNHVIVRYEHLDNGQLKFIRILCTTSDVICKPVEELQTNLDLRFSRLGYSKKVISDVLDVGDRVKFNASALISDTASRIAYCCTSLLYGGNVQKRIPVLSSKPCDYFTNEWKNHYAAILAKIDSDLQIKSSSVTLINETPPMKLIATQEILPIARRLDNSVQEEFFFNPVAETESIPSTSNSGGIESSNPKEATTVKAVKQEKKRPILTTSKIKEEVNKGSRTPVSTIKIEKESGKTQKLLFMHNALGQVIKVLNQNYGLAIVTGQLPDGKSKSLKVIFDVFDLWLDGDVLASEDKKLPDVVGRGTFIKMNAVQVENENCDTFLGTAAIVSESLNDIRNRLIPAEAVFITNLDSVDAAKISNFKIVERILSNMKLTEDEHNIIHYVSSGSFDLENAFDLGPTESKLEIPVLGGELSDIETNEELSLCNSQPSCSKVQTNQDYLERKVKIESSLFQHSMYDSEEDSNDFQDNLDNSETSFDQIEDSLADCNLTADQSQSFEHTCQDELGTNNLNDTPPHLPSFVTNTTGIILLIEDDLTLIKFETFVNGLIRINSFAVLSQECLMSEDAGNLNTKVGYPITFHAIAIEPENTRNYLVTKAYINGSQTLKEKFMAEINHENWIDEWKSRNGFQNKSERALAFLRMQEINQKKLPCILKKNIARIVKIAKDTQSDQHLVIIKVERFDISCYALYISSSSTKYVENQTVFINAVQLAENQKINYSVTSIWSAGEPDIACVEYGYLSLETVDKFHQCLAHSEEILYLAVLISEADITDNNRIVEILGKLSLKKFDLLFKAYIENVCKIIEVEDFNTVKMAKAPFSISNMKAKAGLEISLEELLELLILLNKSYLKNGAKGCLQFVEPSLLDLMSSSGIQTPSDCLPEMKHEKIFWKIPEDWIEQATCMAWEEIVSPPTAGIPETWNVELDTELLVGSSTHKILNFGMMDNTDLWKELSQDSDFPNISMFYEEGDITRSFLTERLKYLKLLVMTRGRFLEDGPIKHEFESCENYEVPRRRPCFPILKQEPDSTMQGSYDEAEESCPVKSESFSDEETDVKPDLGHFEEFDETLWNIKQEN